MRTSPDHPWKRNPGINRNLLSRRHYDVNTSKRCDHCGHWHKSRQTVCRNCGRCMTEPPSLEQYAEKLEKRKDVSSEVLFFLKSERMERWEEKRRWGSVYAHRLEIPPRKTPYGVFPDELRPNKPPIVLLRKKSKVPLADLGPEVQPLLLGLTGRRCADCACRLHRDNPLDLCFVCGEARRWSRRRRLLPV